MISSTRVEIRFGKVIKGQGFEDPELADRFKKIAGNPYGVVHRVISAVYDNVGEEVDKVEYLGIKICSTDKPKVGFALKNGRRPIFPSVIIGFCGDLQDFRETLAHELLHYLEWDEYVVEKKATEIVSSMEKKQGEENEK